ncbi:hypothetical protein R0J87_21985, partial [Halomonas sp. SIMBA_159]
LEAGNDIRTALATFGIDASHGYERIHVDALLKLSQLLSLYIQTKLTVERDKEEMGTIEGFPEAQGAIDPGPLSEPEPTGR